MAIRYDSQTKFGDLDIVDNEGRGHRVRFGGAGNGQNVKTDINFEFDPTCPNQLGIQCPNAPQGQINVLADKVVFSNNAIDIEIYTRLGDTLRPSDFQFDALLKTRAAANAAASFVLQLTGYQNFTFIPITKFTPVYENIENGLPWVYNYDRAAYLAAPDKSSFPEVPGIGNIGRQKFHNGGYHVKHNSWKNHRQNSTYCHICVPRLTDALGNESWGAVSYNQANGQLTYTLDASFLASAPLPIRLDPTFGDTTAGTDTFNMNSDRALAGVFSNPDSGVTLTKFTAYCRYTTSSATRNKGVLFAVSSGAPTGDPLGVGAATALPSSAAWTDFDMNDEALSVTSYALVLIANDYQGTWYKDVSGGNNTHLDTGTSTGQSYTTPNSWYESNSYAGQMNIYATTVSGSLTIVPTSVISTGEAFFNPTITPGAVTIAPSLIDSGEAFYTHELTIGAQTLYLSLIDSGEAFYTASLAAGAVTIAPNAIDSGEAFYTHTVAAGTVTISPSAIGTSETFYDTTVVPGTVTISVSGAIATGETFFSPVVSQGEFYITDIDLIASAEQFYNPTITLGAVFIAPSLIASGENFFTATVSRGAVIITDITLIGSGETFYTHTLSPGSVYIQPSIISSGEVVYNVVVDDGTGSPTVIGTLALLGVGK